MLKKHVRERRYNFKQWLADRGLDVDVAAMNALPWATVLDDDADDCESLSDDVLGRRERRASEALFARMQADEQASTARFLASQQPAVTAATTWCSSNNNNDDVVGRDEDDEDDIENDN